MRDAPRSPTLTAMSADRRESRRAFLQTLFAGAATAGVQAGCYDPGGEPMPTQRPQRFGAVGRAPDGTFVVATADAVLRMDAPHTNEGDNPRLRVGINPVTRAVVQFDPEQVRAMREGVDRISLVLTIACNHNRWGQADRRKVDCHPLTDVFTAGNGRQLGMAGADQRRATGLGATWSSPADPDCADDALPSAARSWTGGLQSAATASAVHTNHLTGDIVWDVTRDVRAGTVAWMIKVADEERPSSPEPVVVGGDGGWGGTVEYLSREGTADDLTRAPRLVFSRATAPNPTISTSIPVNPTPSPQASRPAPSPTSAVPQSPPPETLPPESVAPMPTPSMPPRSADVPATLPMSSRDPRETPPPSSSMPASLMPMPTPTRSPFPMLSATPMPSRTPPPSPTPPPEASRPPQTLSP